MVIVIKDFGALCKASDVDPFLYRDLPSVN